MSRFIMITEKQPWRNIKVGDVGVMRDGYITMLTGYFRYQRLDYLPKQYFVVFHSKLFSILYGVSNV